MEVCLWRWLIGVTGYVDPEDHTLTTDFLRRLLLQDCKDSIADSAVPDHRCRGIHWKLPSTPLDGSELLAPAVQEANDGKQRQLLRSPAYFLQLEHRHFGQVRLTDNVIGCPDEHIPLFDGAFPC